MALTKQDLMAIAFADIDKYPDLALAYRAGDPSVTQNVGAIAAMGAALLQQQEVAAMERFSKERDSTILADAALRGIVPRAKASRVELRAINEGSDPVALELGRVVLDVKGTIYRVETPVVIEPGEEALIAVQQIQIVEVAHTVTDSMPFYAIQIPNSDDGAHLSTLSVRSSQGEYRWASHYTNVEIGEAVYHVEVDDKRRIYVRFGMEEVVGFQPRAGEAITLQVGYSFGDVVPDAQGQFSLDYSSPSEAGLVLKFERLAVRGEAPVGMDVLREMARYPSTYADDAVFLGEFDFLVRKAFQSLRFSSVWNEATEELVRGPKIENMNCLFVAVVGADGQELYRKPLQTADEASQGAVRIDEAELTDLQKEVRQKISAADNSYRVIFIQPEQQEIGVKIKGKASSSFNREDVTKQIRKLVLDGYGIESAAARRGYNKPLYREIYELLNKNVPALSDGGADWELAIDVPNDAARPETWRFVSEKSLSVSVETVNTVRPSWGA